MLDYVAVMGWFPRAILFDFDGVIVDSEPLHCSAYVELMRELGLNLTEDEYYRELIGFDDRGAMRHVFAMRNKELDDATLHQLIERKSKITSAKIRRGEFDALPHVSDFVEAASPRCAMGICTGALRHEVNGMLDAIKLTKYFGAVVSAEDVEIGKPDPSGYLLTARLLSEKIGAKLAASDCLVVEDAPTVARRAKDVGFAVLGLTTTHGTNAWPTDIPTAASLEKMQLKSILDW